MDLSEVYIGRKVIITGDTGFKGSWLALWLQKLGAAVTGIGLDPKTSRDNYVACGLGSVITHHICDIRQYDKIQKIFTTTKPDMVFHLAAQALVSESYTCPRETFDINTQGTANILEAIRHTPSVQAGVMVTSDKCYENQEWVEYLCDRIPLKRPGKPNDLDGAVVFLASDASEYVTGQTLLVDGGISTGATRAMVAKKR